MWLEERVGEACLAGQAARDYARSGKVGRQAHGDVLVPRVEPGWAEELQAALPGCSAEHTDGQLRLTLGGPDGKGAQALSIRAFRRPEISDDAASSGPVDGLLGDLATREISLEAFAVGKDGELVDPFGGVEDLLAERIRPIEDPRKLFRERPHALLTVARAVAETGYAVDAETTRFASRDAANILSASRERWLSGMGEALLGRHPDAALRWLYQTRVLSFLLPEVASLVDFHKTCEVHHKDCWDHTLRVVRKASTDECTRWAALAHDIGKIWTRSVDRRGNVHFYRHEEYGAVLFEGVAARFRMDEQLSERICAVIRLHGRVNLYDSDWSDSAVRRMMRDVGPHLRDLLRFSRADHTTKRPARAAEIRRQLDELERRIAEVEELDSHVPPLPKGLGTDLMEQLDLKAGPILGRIRRGLEALCDSGELKPHQDAAYYLEAVKERGVEAVESLGRRG